MRRLSDFYFRFLLAFFLLFQSCIACSQTIEGTISDVESNLKLNNATIRVNSNSKGVISDKEGDFILNFETPGTYKITVSYIGYADTAFSATVLENKKLNVFIKLTPVSTVLESVFVTASRYEQKNEDIPSRTAILTKDNIERSSYTNTDELLLMLPGVQTDRDFGVFSRNAGVNMRGLNSTARVLILLDGAPINKADGGGINWNRINPEQIERIEVLKGPASAIYGGNAMGGIINIISKKPKEKFSGTIKSGFGTYNTLSLNTYLSGSEIKDDKGLYWNFNNFLRKGDGYLVNTEELKTDYDTTVFLKELGITGLMGYKLSKKAEIELEYDYWDDIRSDGVKVFEALGSYNKFKTHATRLSYTQSIGKAELKIQPFYQNEIYFRQNESVSKKSFKYKYYDTNSDRKDYGVYTSYSIPLNQNIQLVTGTDLKQGNVNTSEIYYTSTDVTRKQGQLNQYAIFAVSEMNSLNRKFNLSLGLRYDYIEFLNGAFKIETPSQLTAFIENYPVVFTDEKWGALSPKIGGKYHFNDKISTYVSYAIGYRPPMLDDICTNRSITKGFKIANTKLAPEYLHNYEAGFDLKLSENIKLEASVFNSIGKGFQYFVGTGDSVDTGSDALKPVLIRDNIATVKMYGVESSLDVEFLKDFIFNINQAYNYSYISEFKNDKYENKDLNGKFLMEVPRNTVNTSLMYKRKFISANISYHYISRQWIDDENTSYTPEYNYFNIKFLSQPVSYLKVGLNIINVLNKKYVNNKGQLCPGRFIMFDLSLSVNELFQKLNN